MANIEVLKYHLGRVYLGAGTDSDHTVGISPAAIMYTELSNVPFLCALAGRF